MKKVILLSLPHAIIILVFSFAPSKKLVSVSVTKHESKVRLYILDGGTIENVDPTGFGLKREDVSFYHFPAPCYLVVHPKGTLIWDTGGSTRLCLELFRLIRSIQSDFTGPAKRYNIIETHKNAIG